MMLYISQGHCIALKGYRQVWCVLDGMLWYGMVWYGMVWYGMVWYGKDLWARGFHWSVTLAGGK